jgi:heme exporter protein B
VETPELPGLAAGFGALLRRDLLLAWRRRGQAANPLIFFAMATALVPLAVGPEPALLARLAPGMVWIMALLGTLLAANSLFHEDFVDGALEHLVLSPQPLWLLVLAKVTAHWLVIGVPITLFAPVLGLMLALPEAGFAALVAGLALGTLVFSLLGAVGGGLTVALGGGSVLLSLLVLPLYVPVLIFGTSAVSRALEGGGVSGPLALLGAIAALALLVAPFAAAAALRAGIDG